MNGDLNIALILKLVDQMTGPAKPALAAIKQINVQTEAAGRAGVAWSNQQLAANQARIGALRGEAMGVLALGAGLVAITEPAIQAERRLAEISKVIDFEGADGFSLLRNDILDLVTSGGLATTAEGIEDIVAAAGRMGVVDENLPDAQKRAELLEFAVAASKMSVAFGISADEAGTSLARWRQNLHLSQEQAMLLGDTVNLLGNTMATNEADILTVINRQGVVAQTAGLAASEIAALSASLLAAGSSPEIAATGMKNFLSALTRGESATQRQSEVFEALGIDATELAKRMQEDAAGGMMQVLEALEQMEPYRQTSLVGDLFGEEAKGAIMPLIANSELLRETLDRTADSASLLGLMEAEYQSQAATTFAQRQRLFEYVKGLSVVIGSQLLPALNDLMATVMPLVSQMTDWAAAHPELIALAFKLAAGVVAVKAASIALRFGIYSALTPILHLVRAGSWLLVLLPKLGAGLLGLLNPVKLIRGAFIALRVALIATGIGAVVAGLAMAGVWIYNNWSGLKTFFVNFGSAFMEALGPARPLVEGLIGAIKPLWEWLGKLLGPIDASTEQWAGWGETAGRVVGETVMAVANFVGNIIQWFKDLPSINWAALVPEFSWDGVMKTLEWLSWLAPIRWLEFIPEFDWADVLPDIDWAGIINLQGIKDAWASVTGWLDDAASNLWDILPEMPDLKFWGDDEIEDPKTLLAAAAAAELLEDQFPEISKAAEATLKDIQGIIRGIAMLLIGAGLSGKGADLVQSIADGMLSKLDAVREAATQIGQTIRDALPGGALGAALATSAIAGGAFAASGEQEILQNIDRRPALGTQGRAASISNTVKVGQIVIHAAPGMSAEDVAYEVRRQIEAMQDSSGDLHDGGDF